MVAGKNKCLVKEKKTAKKKVVDPFSKKHWYDVKTPATFNIRNIGKTLHRTQGTKIAPDVLKGHVLEGSLANLQNDGDAFRKVKLITEDVHGKNYLINFPGMDLTRDKICSMVKKWQTTTEAHVDGRTTDGYLLCLFCWFYKNTNNQSRKTSYAQHQRVHQIQKKTMAIMTANDLKKAVNRLIPDCTGKDTEKDCTYPLHDAFVRKVKMLKKPKFKLGKATELRGEGSSSGKATRDETGAKVEGADGYELPVPQSV
uniref:Small ribosomal subunit protein eS1 n=1 Tax=Loxodonta africana TaxID=9785 RepID=G3UG10_LOXAF